MRGLVGSKDPLLVAGDEDAGGRTVQPRGAAIGLFLLVVGKGEAAVPGAIDGADLLLGMF